MAKRTKKQGDPPATPVAVAIFDDRCSVCRRFGGLLRRMVGPDRLAVVPCGSEAQRELAPQVTEAACRKAFTMVEPSGRVLTEGAAASRAIAMAPALAPFRWMVETRATQAAARKAYGVVRLLRPRD